MTRRLLDAACWAVSVPMLLWLAALCFRFPG